LLITSDLLLRHRQKIHDREKRATKQTRRPRSQSISVVTKDPSTTAPKSGATPRAKRRRESISVAPLPPRNLSISSVQGSQPNNPAIYMPASAPASTTNFFNFNYPSPSSTSPSSTGAELMECAINSNYVNPADLFSVGPFAAPQNFATPASTTSSSSIIPPTPPFSTYIPSFSGSKNFNTVHRASIDSGMFDFSPMMTTVTDALNTQCPPIPDENNMMLDSAESVFSPPQMFDMTSPASFTNDSGFQSAHSNVPFQFAWQPTSLSHGRDEYNTSLPFEPSHSSVSPMDIIMKQDSKLNSASPFSAGALHNAQLFAAFPDSNDVFDLLIDDREPATYTRKEIIDSSLRANLIATVQAAGVTATEIPPAIDLSTYVSAYWEFIHPHAPIFFKPGFVAQFVQEGILFGMCALGALAMSATQQAITLNICAKAVIQDV
jgi:hypothetical protein